MSSHQQFALTTHLTTHCWSRRSFEVIESYYQLSLLFRRKMRSFIIIWRVCWLLFLRILCNHRFHFDIPYQWFSSVWQKVISLSLSCPWTYPHALGLLTWTCWGFEILWKPNCCLVVYLHILKFFFSSENSEIATKHSLLELSMVAEVKMNRIWGALSSCNVGL